MAKPKPVFYKPKRARKLTSPAAPLVKPRKETQEIGLIQGQVPGSILEWNVAQALNILGQQYEYQYQVGMQGVEGSQRLDFLVYTPGMPTPVQVQGRYWHTGIHSDELDNMQIVKQMGGRVRQPVIVWEENCQTVDDALSFLRQNLAIG